MVTQGNIKELNLDELKTVLLSWQQPAFRARQISTWIYKKGVLDFGQMTDIPLELKARLKENFRLFDLRIDKLLESRDGTKKFLFALQDNNFIEAVLIPAGERVTGCVSSQVGCKYRCSFCASGLKGFKRNLSCSEIIEQVLYLKNNGPLGRLTHIVFMGTGEPLDNYENVLKAIRVINSEYSLNIGARRITVSTCGIIPAIERMSNEGLQIELSVSLHAADDALRTRLVPVNKVYPLKELIAACRSYVGKTKRQVTFEYTLIKGINSDLQSAVKLGKILKGFDCKVNLIPCNSVEELKLIPADKNEILAFKDSLFKSGINVTIRKSRGEDISSACGQLRLGYGKSSL